MKKLIQKIFLKNLHFVILISGLFFRLQDYTESQGNIHKNEEKIPVIKSKIRKHKKRYELLEGYLDDLEESKRQVSDLKEEIDRVKKQLPTEIQETDILDLFAKEAELVNIKNPLLKPGAEKKRDFYIGKDYQFKATGTYLQFMVYFERLERHPRIIDMVELEMISSKSKKNRGRFQLVDLTARMEVFKYRSKVKEGGTPLEKGKEGESLNKKKGS